MLRVDDVPLGGEPGGIDASVLSIADQPWLLPGLLRLVDELLRHALFGKEFVDVLLPTRLDVGKFQRATPSNCVSAGPSSGASSSCLRGLPFRFFGSAGGSICMSSSRGICKRSCSSFTVSALPRSYHARGLALLPTEARPMGELSDGVNIVAFQ